jgi:cation transport regulator
MPYDSVSELPASVKDNLPEHAQEIYMKAFNNAWQEYKDSSRRLSGSSQEETAHKVAWAAVKKVYKKDEKTGQWKPKHSKVPA